MIEAGEPAGLSLREPPAMRRYQHDRLRLPDICSNRVNGLEQRLRLQNHPRAAAIRHIVYRAMPIFSELPQVPRPDGKHVALNRSRENPFSQRGLYHPRKNRDDVEPHS
jgi:hypothetical protein